MSDKKVNRRDFLKVAAIGAAPEPAPGDASEGEVSLDGIAAVLAERRRSDYPALELADAGFTITEQVHIGNDARSEYEQALTLLRQERFAEGIELLRGVIESSPAVTAPYIDDPPAFTMWSPGSEARGPYWT